MRAVTAADQKDMPHLAALDERDDLLRVSQHRAVCKARHQHMPAVNAAHAVVVLVPAERERLLDDGRKVLAAARIRLDMAQTRIAHHRSRVHAVLIAWALRHQTVGGEQHRRGNVLELRLLALPCRAEIARKVRMFFQSRITVRGQHFAVRVDVDALSRRLLEQLRQVAQVVPGNHDERAFFDVGRHFCGLRRAECARIGLIEQLHAPEIHLPELDDQRQPFLDRMRAIDRAQALVKPRAHLVIRVAKIHRVVCIGGHAFHAEQQRGTQRNRIRVALPQLHDRTRFSAEFLSFRAYPLGEFRNRLIVKIDIGQGDEQAVHQQPVDDLCALTGRSCRLGQANEFVHQLILQRCRIRLLAADTHAHAALVACGLLALKAKHI